MARQGAGTQNHLRSSLTQLPEWRITAPADTIPAGVILARITLARTIRITAPWSLHATCRASSDPRGAR